MKTIKKKLKGRNGQTIEVDAAIYRWRKKLKDKGIVLGKGMAAAKREAKKAAKAYADKKIPLVKKEWF